MATFGVPAPLNEDPEGEDKQSVDNTNHNIAKYEEEEGLQTGRSQWTSLSKAREEKANAANFAAAVQE